MSQVHEEKKMRALKEKLGYAEGKALEIFMDVLMEKEKQGAPWDIGAKAFDVIVIHRNLKKLQEPLSPQEKDRAMQALSREEEIHQMVSKEMPHLTAIRYSEPDLLAFCAAVPPAEKQYLPAFLSQLHEQGQITLDQYERLLVAEGLEKVAPSQPPVKSETALEQDLFIRVVLYCLEHCMHEGSRLGAFLRISNYEDARFFDGVITNPNVDYVEEVVEEGPLLSMSLSRRAAL